MITKASNGMLAHGVWRVSLTVVLAPYVYKERKVMCETNSFCLQMTPGVYTNTVRYVYINTQACREF